MTMTEGFARAENRAHLRAHAEALIHEGRAAVATIGGGALGDEALELLYRRASSPDFAADALKLLHELQTHQVELDLLLEEMHREEADLTKELAHYQALYELAPVAYLVIGKDGRVLESNAAAGTLLGFVPEHSVEQTLTQFLAPPGRADVANLIEAMEPGLTETCMAQLASLPDRRLSIRAKLSPSGKTIMMVLSQAPSPNEADPEDTER